MSPANRVVVLVVAYVAAVVACWVPAAHGQLIDKTKSPNTANEGISKSLVDGRSSSLLEVILRHRGEAEKSRKTFERLKPSAQRDLLEFLGSLQLFPPDDTASNLDPGDPGTPGYPQFGHGSIKLTVLFNDPSDKE